MILTAKHICVSLLKTTQLVPYLHRDPSQGIKEHHSSEKHSKSRLRVSLDWAAASLLKQGSLSRLRHGLLTHGPVLLKPDAKTSFYHLAQSSALILCSDQHPLGNFSPSILCVRGNSPNKNCSDCPTWSSFIIHHTALKLPAHCSRSPWGQPDTKLHQLCFCTLEKSRLLPENSPGSLQSPQC